MKEINKNELYSQLVCALTHDIKVCDGCCACEGIDAAEIRINLIRNLSDYMKMPLPFEENYDE